METAVFINHNHTLKNTEIFSLLVFHHLWRVLKKYWVKQSQQCLRSFLIRNFIFLAPYSVTLSHLFIARYRLLKPYIGKGFLSLDLIWTDVKLSIITFIVKMFLYTNSKTNRLTCRSTGNTEQLSCQFDPEGHRNK